MINKIVAIKAHNRAARFAATLQSLEGCDGIDEYKIIVCVDGSPTQPAHVECCRQSSLKHQIQLYLAPIRLGCAGNTRRCLEMAWSSDPDMVIHIEDDVEMYLDTLRYLEWGMTEANERSNIFAVCSFNRKSWQRQIPETPGIARLSTSLWECYLRNWFEPGAAWAMNRREWSIVQSNGGIFGSANANQLPKGVRGEEFKRRNVLDDNGSWAASFCLYHMWDKACIFPNISRCQNTGEDPYPISRFNPSPALHKQDIYDDNWIETFDVTPEVLLKKRYFLLDDVVFAEPEKR